MWTISILFYVWIVLVSLQIGVDAFCSRHWTSCRPRHPPLLVAVQTDAPPLPTELADARDRSDKLGRFHYLVEKGRWDIATSHGLDQDFILQHFKFFVNLFDLQKYQKALENRTYLKLNKRRYVMFVKTVASQVNPTLQQRLPLTELMAPFIHYVIPHIMDEEDLISDMIWSLGRFGYDCKQNSPLIKMFLDRFLKNSAANSASSFNRGLMGLAKLGVNRALLDNTMKDTLLETIVCFASDFTDRETSNLVYS